MAKDFAKKFYMGKAWKKCRQSYIAERIRIDGGMCEECHKNLGYIIHHKVALTPQNIDNPDITLSSETTGQPHNIIINLVLLFPQNNAHRQ